MGTHQNQHCLKIIIFLIVSVLIVIRIHHSFRSTRTFISKSSYYTVVLDCGSTGTRVNVYEWLQNSTNDGDLPIMLHSFPDNSTKSPLGLDACRYHCIQTEPGLDKFLHNSSGLSAALEPLLLWAEHQVPSQRHEETPIFLLATAGLRRLASEDADWVLRNAEAVLKKHRFVYRRNWIRVLTGKEEAYHGWVALNYKMGRLGNSSVGPTLGVLDLGGSSFQVVMDVGESRKNQHFFESEIGSLGHQLLAYSLPAFGLNAAFDRSIVILSEEHMGGDSSDAAYELRHPCLYSGFIQNYTCYGCHIWLSATNPLNVSGTIQNHQPSTFYLVGDPDWERCQDIARATAINSSRSDWWQLSADMDCEAHSSSRSANSLSSTNSSRPTARFHALSGFFAVYNMLNLNPKANITELMERGQQLCSRSWNDMERTYGTRFYMEQSCFRVLYLASLIEDGLCLNDAEIIFGPGDVSWTLGAALVEGGDFWLGRTEMLASSFSMISMEVVFSPTFLFALFLCLAFIVYCWNRKSSATALPNLTLSKRGPAGVISLPSYIYPKRQLK
ncbi:probable apyrase 7 [Magnolia sinica]|uniref:probable apyrase 7 n=1 Tax=Magnolia sinica TaxID=86752 RepID=UPI002657D1DC|nr:probable apyrase 7 [Magnolia sinica]